MPIDPVRAQAVRHAVGQVLWDAPLMQGIFNVTLERAPTRVRFNFFTFWPCFARVEIFRMVHGELGLDMEKENLIRTEIELFGNAKTAHSVLVTELEQERRFWYRISVPAKSPDFPNATGHVRSRGEFFTPRRNTTVTVNRIHVLDDSDTSGDGELDFSLGLYNASDPRNLLAQPRLSPEFGVSSGSDINRPFGPGGQTIQRAPDFIGVYVFGVDDDTSIWGAPWYGLGIVGRRPPDTMPDHPFTRSETYADMTEALHVFATGGKPGRQEGRFDFFSVKGRLHFSVHGGFATEVFDTLSERSIPPWKTIAKTKMALDRGGRFAGLVGLEDGVLALAIDTDGRLARAAAAERGVWEPLESPAFADLVAKATRRSALLLLGRDLDGMLHAATLREPRRDQPCWRALGRTAATAPATIEDSEGRVHVVFNDSRRRLWHTLVTPGRDAEREPFRLSRQPTGRAALHLDRDGTLVVATTDEADSLLVLRLDADGQAREHEATTASLAHLLAITAEDDREPLIVAIDHDDHILVRPLDASATPFEPLATLEDLLEGLTLADPAKPREAPPKAA